MSPVDTRGGAIRTWRTCSARFETRHRAGTALALHRHLEPYLAVVIDGGYVEASSDGVFWCEPGCVTLHPALHAHTNRFRASRARVLNFPCPPGMAGVGEGCRVLRLAGLSHRAISGLDLPDLLAALRDATPVQPIVMGSLAVEGAALMEQHPALPVAAVARQVGVSREHLSRAFHRSFGFSPAAYRAERRLRRALGLLVTQPRTLSRTALEGGFADHAHLTRTVRAAAGMPPSVLRRWLQRG